jgi:succinoglycan biosynthesis transport protein ExoP
MIVKEARPRNLDENDSDPDDGVQLPSLITLAGTVWRRKSLVALGIVVGVVIGSLYYAQTTPIYESAAQVLVVKKRPQIVSGDSGYLSHFEDYVNTHRTLILSPLIVERAIERGDLARLACFEGASSDLTEEVISNLSVDKVSKNEGASAQSILGLSFRGKVPDECGLVVNAILDSYKQFLGETYRDMSEDTAKLITDARDMLQKDLTRQETGYREFRQKSPLIWQGAEKINPRQDRLTMIESQRSTLLMRKAEFEANLATIENARKAGLAAEKVIALASDLSSKSQMVTGDKEENVTLHSRLLPLLMEEQRLLQDLGPKHPHVVSVRKQIEATRNFFALPSAAYGKVMEQPTGNGRQASPEELVDLYVQYLQHELAHLKKSDELLAAMYEEEHKAAKQLASYEIQDEEFRRGIERTQALYDGVVKQLQDIGMVKDYGGFEARVIAPAGIGKKVVPNALRVFPVSGLLGVLFGFGLVYVAELLDKSFKAPEEISRQLGLPVIGHIPLFEVAAKSTLKTGSRGNALAPALRTVHQSRSPESEAYRGLRTALYFSSVGEGHKVIQVTSPNPGDGKSTLIANIAVSMAQSGKKVLLVDADLRKPRLHRLFDVKSDVGLASLIIDDAELADAIQDSGVPNLSLIACGPVPPDPAELLTSPRFSDLLATLRDQFDYVLVDTAPLLAVTDPCIVAARVDGVLLTIRISKDGRQHALRAKSILSTIDVNVLGVIVNGVASGDGRYAYGYKQDGYGYMDGYHDDENHKGNHNGRSSQILEEVVQR